MNMTSQPSSSRTPPVPTLPRGAACLPCRRRKMRCDGAHPTCTQCATKGRSDDCEYPGDVQGLTRIQLMEENIALMEARIRDLEEPGEEGSGSVRLWLPGGAGAEGEAGVGLFVREAAPQVEPDLSIATPAVYTEPTAPHVNALVRTFIPHATHLGFFLNIPRFLQVFDTANPVNSPMAHPTGPLYDPLLSTVCLWGSRLSSDEDLRHYETYLANRTVHLLSSSILNAAAPNATQDDAILAIIQAEVLLANYFFAVGRLLEGRYHCSAATALCVSCRLNTLTSPYQRVTSNPTVEGTDALFGLLASGGPLDAVSLGERIDAFWTVYALDTVWAVALGSASSMGDSAGTEAANRPNMLISTPWPLRRVDYAQGRQVGFNDGYRPIADLLGNPEFDFAGASPLALRAQAAALFSRASRLATKYGEMTTLPGMNASYNEITRLIAVITRFIDSLPSTVDGEENREFLVAATLARVALVLLHRRVSGHEAVSRETYIRHAQAVVELMRSMQPLARVLDPIMAILLTAVCQAFLDEITVQRSEGSTRRDNQQYSETLNTSLDQLLRILTELGTVCPLMNSQAIQIREYQSRSEI